MTCCKGPGYPTPLEAMRGKREEIMYVTCIIPPENRNRPDYLATVDLNPESATYGTVIHRLKMPHIGDEMHHFGWNSCSSACNDASKKRDKIILPCLLSDRIYVVDIKDNSREPKLYRELNNLRDWDCSAPHTSHCLGSGMVMISCMGDAVGNHKGSFILLDEDFNIVRRWENQKCEFGYDFWYQPFHNVMISTEWGSPKCWRKNFDIADVEKEYGRSLNVYNWTTRDLEQVIDLGQDGLIPLEIRFRHDPESPEGFVGCCLGSSVYRIFKAQNKWAAEKVIQVPPKTVENWILPNMPGLITDIIVSLDDRFLYFSNWLHGDVRQYDITNGKKPILVGQLFLGGSILSDSKVKVIKDEELKTQPDPLYINNKRVYGSPQMLQLSLDGKRLYVTFSLYSGWDQQFYPEMTKNGSVMLQVDVNTITGGLTLNRDFCVDFRDEPEGPVLAHEMHYPGGDCSTDIWLSDKQNPSLYPHKL
ncbi:methanethiol oxidase [Octopus sinensis]|uniref:Methanethiol oxidase n=1 Tax=Octopus sinensis TaxID=2607531 RepID=A0A6P7TDP4_9MOLL|nr:methanethiol oxidase [Octopus sinensis]